MDRWLFDSRVWTDWNSMVLPIRTENGFDVSTEADAISVSPWMYQLRRFVKALAKTRSREKSLRHIETLSFGTKRSVHLLECEGQRFLVADGLSAPVPLTQRFAAEDRR
ncbi:flagellar biosynthetic protein FliO [Terriglobus sp. RCC_193]|uniref:flagellar biosynthetic protein FliO n=1 Tax=Terriglobus sp. RCC_193 TaxID=3239218 RepID=UPI0035256E9C